MAAAVFTAERLGCPSRPNSCKKVLPNRPKDAQKLLGNSPGNHLLTSPKIQKQLCKACANETTKAILKDIGERNFAILVDESRDASIKEQMAVILRLVAVFCIFLVLIF